MEERVGRNARERKTQEAEASSARRRLEDLIAAAERVQVAARINRLRDRARRLGAWTFRA
jgi:hypothetical protein